MKTMIVVVLFGVIAMVASQRGVQIVEHNPESVQVVDNNPESVQVVDQNPAIEARAGGFTGIIRDRVTSLKSRVHDRTNRVLTLLGVNVADRNSPIWPTPVQVVDNSQGGVNVVDNNPYPTPVHVVENSNYGGHNSDNIYPTPVQVVDNSHNGVNVVDNNRPYHGNQHDGGLVNVDPGFSQPGKNQGGFENVDTGFYQPGLGGIENVDTGFYRPGIDQGIIDNVDPGFNRPGAIQGRPDQDVYYRRRVPVNIGSQQGSQGRGLRTEHCTKTTDCRSPFNVGNHFYAPF